MDSYTGILPSTPQKNDTVEPDNNIKKHIRYGLKKKPLEQIQRLFFTTINGK
jgi:hypothetical protein